MRRRIGLLGCGRWGCNILRDLLRLDCKVHVYDPDPEACQAAHGRGAVSAVTEFTELSDELDGYVVASPTVSHFESVNSLLSRHKPVFCEKPLTPDLASARELAAHGNGRVFIMDKWRYHPGIEALASLAKDGELGTVQQVRTRRVQWGQPHEDVDGVWILLPHDLSIVAHILGQLPAPAAAIGDYSGGRMDGLVAILGNAPGAVIEVSSRQPVSARLVSVSFEQGTAWLTDPLDDHICVYRHHPGREINPEGHEKVPVSTEWPLFLELQRFTNYINGGPPPYTDVNGAVEQVALIEQLRAMAGR